MLLRGEEEAVMVGEGEADARLQHPTGRPDEDGDGSWLLEYGYNLVSMFYHRQPITGYPGR